MKEKKENRVRKPPANQVLISTKVRNSEDHRVLIRLQRRDQLRLPVIRLFYRHRQLLVHQEVLQGDQFLLFCTHCGRRHRGECWRLTGSCLSYGSNEHKIKDCSRARSFTSPRTGGKASAVQRGNKSVASPSVPRQVTQTVSRQDARAPTRAYAMKAVEDIDAPDV